MKSRTLFSGFLETNNNFSFAFFLIAFRIIFGVFLLLASLNYLLNFELPLDFIIEIPGATILSIIFAIVGTGFVFGLLMRPLSFIGVISFIFMCTLFQTGQELCIIECLLFIVLFLMTSSGGFGHIFGLDGLFFSAFEKKKTWRWFFA